MYLKFKLVFNFRWSHVSEKPLSCDRCSMTFTSKSQFAIHIRTHSAGQNYECTICGRTFIRDSYLIRHHNRVHRENRGTIHNNINATINSVISGNSQPQQQQQQIQQHTHTHNTPEPNDGFDNGTQQQQQQIDLRYVEIQQQMSTSPVLVTQQQQLSSPVLNSNNRLESTININDRNRLGLSDVSGIHLNDRLMQERAIQERAMQGRIVQERIHLPLIIPTHIIPTSTSHERSDKKNNTIQYTIANPPV